MANPPAWKQRPCPTCDAQPGQRCHKLGTNKPAHSPHYTRKHPPGTTTTPGQPPKILNPNITEYIINGLQQGKPITTVVQAAGIHEATFYRWMTETDETNPHHAEYRAFREACSRARAHGAERLVDLIESAAERHVKSEKHVTDDRGNIVYGADGEPLKDLTWEQDWRAAAFVLERSYSKEWGKRQILEVTAGDGSVVPLTPITGGNGRGVQVGMSLEALERAHESLRELVAEEGRRVEPVVGEVVSESAS